MNRYYEDVFDAIGDFENIFHVIPETPVLGEFWHDEKGESTIDPQKVKVKIPFEEPRFKDAESNHDFEYIFQNEYRKAKSKDVNIFRNRLIEIWQCKCDEIKQFKINDFEADIEIINRYINYLKSKAGNVGEGKPEKTFADYLDDPDPERFADWLKNEFSNVVGSGSRAAALFTALEKSGKMKPWNTNAEIYRAMSQLFGKIGHSKGFDAYLNPSSNLNKSNGQRELILKMIENIKTYNSQH